MRLTLLLAGAAAAALSIGSAAQAGGLSAQYYAQDESVANADFGTCCSSPPATLEVITLGSGLTGGRPTLAAGSTVADGAVGGALGWWTPNATTGISATGTGTFTLNQTNNMFYPNSGGSDDSKFFETAILSGTLTGTGADAQITVKSDDDALVYVNGAYVGGNAGVTCCGFSTIDLGTLATGSKDSLQIFYADRAQVGAYLDVGVTGASVPEPVTWAVMLMGFGGVGAALRSRRKNFATA